MSNAGIDEASEEIQEIDIAEIKKLKVRVHVIAEQSLACHGDILTSGTRASRQTGGTRIEYKREQARTCG